MTEQDLFLFLATNLKIRVEDGTRYVGYGYDHGQVVRVNLLLTNPETGKDEVISTDEITIDT